MFLTWQICLCRKELKWIGAGAHSATGRIATAAVRKQSPRNDENKSEELFLPDL